MINNNKCNWREVRRRLVLRLEHGLTHHAYGDDVIVDHEVLLLGVVEAQEAEEGAWEHAVQTQEQHVHSDVEVQHEYVWGVGCNQGEQSKNNNHRHHTVFFYVQFFQLEHTAHYNLHESTKNTTPPKKTKKQQHTTSTHNEMLEVCDTHVLFLYIRIIDIQ